MGQVLQFTAKPKIDTYRHRRYTYTVAYIPDRKQWLWKFQLGDMMIHGHTSTHDEAVSTAKLHIDLSEGV